MSVPSTNFAGIASEDSGMRIETRRAGSVGSARRFFGPFRRGWVGGWEVKLSLLLAAGLLDDTIVDPVDRVGCLMEMVLPSLSSCFILDSQ